MLCYPPFGVFVGFGVFGVGDGVFIPVGAGVLPVPGVLVPAGLPFAVGEAIINEKKAA